MPCNKSSPNLVVYNSEHNSGFAKVALFQAATWWVLVPGFGIHGAHFELQAADLQRGSETLKGQRLCRIYSSHGHRRRAKFT